MFLLSILSSRPLLLVNLITIAIVLFFKENFFVLLICLHTIRHVVVNCFWIFTQFPSTTLSDFIFDAPIFQRVIELPIQICGKFGRKYSNPHENNPNNSRLTKVNSQPSHMVIDAYRTHFALIRSNRRTWMKNAPHRRCPPWHNWCFFGTQLFLPEFFLVPMSEHYCVFCIFLLSKLVKYYDRISRENSYIWKKISVLEYITRYQKTKLSHVL